MTGSTRVPIVIGLNAVIVAADEAGPFVLATRDSDDGAGLPHGPFDPVAHRTFELGLREWVHSQTGFEPGYVEQLYTFGDRGRELPRADLRDAPSGARFVSVCYLGLTPERTDISAFEAAWTDWYRYFPWEDHRKGRPTLIDEVIGPALQNWATQADGPVEALEERIRIAFGMDGSPWVEERTLERYELLYEAGLTTEAIRDETPSIAQKVEVGTPMRSDHRRILATAIGRLRGKIKYRPVIFDLVPARFTLFKLQQTVEAILGTALHKQNFRRALDKSGLVQGTGDFATATGGRPAELYRFNHEGVGQGAATGISTPRAHS